jgi:CheY-like chemotaxis protein
MSTRTKNSASSSVETVLVLDNDVLFRMPICQYLRDCGYRVLEAANTDEATAILQKHEIEIDVVLSDMELAGELNGFKFASWARSVRPGLQIVFAGTPERAARAAGQLCEQGPMLKRPYEPEMVSQRIKRLFAARAQQGQGE